MSPPRASSPPAAAPASRFAGLAGEFVAGRHLDLLAPLRFLAPGARPVDSPAAPDRRALAAALARANADFGHPRAVERAARLADPATRVVVTGQQTGLFGGPLLALVKAAGAARWAAELEAADGRPTEAVFWMATEDHDWAEVATATALSADGPVDLALGADPVPLAPVGERRVGDAVGPLLARFAALATGEWSAAWLERLAGWWQPQARFGEAFARTHVALLGEAAPLYLDAMLPELKAAERPFLAALIERRAGWGAALAAREAEIVRRGFTPQVAPQPGASPLFLTRAGARRRIEWRGDDRFVLRGDAGEAAVGALLETLEREPAAISPGALARPAIQDAVLGSTLVLLGPGELAYFAQAAASYELLGIAPPTVALRPHALVVDAPARRRLAALGATLDELLERPGAIVERIARAAGGGFVAPVHAEILAALERLEAPAAALDPTLARPFARTRGTVGRALARFATRVEAAATRRDAEAGHRLARLTDLVRPGGVAQERRLATGWFAARWGDGFGPRLAAGLELDPTRLSVIDPATEVPAGVVAASGPAVADKGRP